MAKKKTVAKPVVEEVDPKLELTIQIYNFVNSMKGKSRATPSETKQMFELYNKYYNANERNTNCDLCAIRIYSKLEKIYKNYVDNKRIR